MSRFGDKKASSKPMGQQTDRILRSARHDFRLVWKELFLTDILYKVVAFVVLTPLVGLLLRLSLAASGTSVLADQDILYFLLGPIGWATLIVVGGAWIAIVALEQAALMTIVAGATQERRTSVRVALLQTIPLAWPVLQVTARIVAIGLVTAAPFLLAIGGVYLTLLREFDINYYLTEKPPAFWIAAGLGGGIGAVLVLALLRVLLPAVYALPLLLFEGRESKETLRTSRDRTTGHLRFLALWILGWFAAMAALSTIGSSLVGLAGSFVLPMISHSLWIAVIGVGLLLILWSLVNLGVTLLGASTFAVLLVNLYRDVAGEDRPVLEPATQVSTEGSSVMRFSRRTLLLGFGGALVMSALVGGLALRNIQTKDTTQVTAHRGASAAAPENSMAAVEQAIADKADWVEIDVQESSDGVVLVAHDEDLKKAAGVDLKIWNSTAEELRTADIGSKFSPEFADQRVPTLEEVLLACKGKVGVNIELKHYGHAEKLEQRVVDLVEAHGMVDDVLIMSLKYDSVQKVRRLRPNWTIGLLSAVAVGDLTKVDTDFLAVNTGIATRSFISSARKRGKAVHVWTVNDPITMSTMIGRGVKSLITDKPALAREVLRQRAELGSLERLLLELAILFGAPPSSSVEDA
jgi:glycerophosphoryl diester phosphodiesterase